MSGGTTGCGLPRRGLGCRTYLIFTGVAFAFLLCAMNLSILARRTMTSTSTSSSRPISSFDVPSASEELSSPAENVSCLQARKDTVPQYLFGNLTFPLINLGFPKMGTSSIQSFFGCAGYRSMHYRCAQSTLCAECALRSARAGEPPLKQCGKADVYSQMDGTVDGELYFPQIELLEELVRGYPDATFLLTFRSVDRWYHSISNWPPSQDPRTLTHFHYLKDRLRLANITGLPAHKGESLEEFSDFFCGHVRRVREIVPARRLVEIDIEDPAAGSRMSDVFGLDEECWDQANVNANLHPELTQAKGGVPWFIHGKTMLRGKNGAMRRKRNLPPPPLVNASGGMDKIESIVGMEQVDDETNGNRFKGRTANVSQSILEETRGTIHNMESMGRVESNFEKLDPGFAQGTPDSCRRLIAHENGHWDHARSEDDVSPVSNGEPTPQIYYPEEIAWLEGRNVPQNFGKCTRSNKFLMYNSALGHQCGCGVRGYAPSRSAWVPDGADVAAAARPDPDRLARSPTLRLARRLAIADATLCFSGDSMDYQIYSAFHNNLRRIDQIHRAHRPGEDGIVSVVSREIPVTHATEPGNVDDWFLHGRRPPDGDDSFLHARRPPPGGFGSIYSILETKAFFRDEEWDGKVKKARIRYYMSYGWSPWNIPFMEDCNVIIMNLGLHYDPDGNHTGRETRHALMDDMLAAITYLSNFTASKDNRIAVWRSALPQHFATNDGHFHGWNKLPKDHSCSVIDKSHAPSQQVYNKLYDDAFSKLCRHERQTNDTTMQSCDRHRYSCKVNPAAEVGFQTIYQYWRANNCTEQMERERSRLGNISSGIEEKDVSVTGSIFRWGIFDLFDVPRWHSKDLDCSHFCYIPPLFEAAFERLELLIHPLLSSF